MLDRIRDEIWLKLWGNVCFNPISALTHATLDVICSDPATRALSKAIMVEAQAIAESFGVKFRVDVERRIEGARKVGAHKTSMLQDLERGRPMEIDPLVTVVQEMGRLTSIPTPALDTVLALVAQRAKLAGLYENDRSVAEKPRLLHECIVRAAPPLGGLLPALTPSFAPEWPQTPRAVFSRAVSCARKQNADDGRRTIFAGIALSRLSERACLPHQG